jgi:hypothetical protein
VEGEESESDEEDGERDEAEGEHQVTPEYRQGVGSGRRRQLLLYRVT